MTLVQAKIPEELADWIGKNFPHGFRQAFIEECFVNLRALIESGNLPPTGEYGRQATIAAISKLATEDFQSLKDSTTPTTED